MRYITLSNYPVIILWNVVANLLKESLLFLVMGVCKMALSSYFRVIKCKHLLIIIECPLSFTVPLHLRFMRHCY